MRRAPQRHAQAVKEGIRGERIEKYFDGQCKPAPGGQTIIVRTYGHRSRIE
jgi:hypothetical protein